MTQFGEPMGELTAADGFVNISLAWVCETTSLTNKLSAFHPADTRVQRSIRTRQQTEPRWPKPHRNCAVQIFKTRNWLIYHDEGNRRRIMTLSGFRLLPCKLFSLFMFNCDCHRAWKHPGEIKAYWQSSRAGSLAAFLYAFRSPLENEWIISCFILCCCTENNLSPDF